MSLARAVTKRMKRADRPSEPSPSLPPARSQSVKTPTNPIDRSKISAPVALVSTTNMLSYNAPDIATLKKKSSPLPSPISTSSADDSDHSISGRSRASSQASRETLTDASSVSDSPTSPTHNHLSTYFVAAKNVRKSVSSGNLKKSSPTTTEKIPAIPERALSHSKRAHERLAQKRSVASISRTSSTRSTHRTSQDMFSPTIIQEEEADPHPFGAELEQLNEVVEEFGGAVRAAESELDLATIRDRCLGSFCAADYIKEIQPLFDERFGTINYPAPLAWI